MSDVSSTPRTDKILEAIREIGTFTDEERMDERRREAKLRDVETFEKVRGAIETLASVVNGSGNHRIIRAAFVAEMTRTHRHLQGELIYTLLRALGDLGMLAQEDSSRWTDARNARVYQVLAKLRGDLANEVYFD